MTKSIQLLVGGPILCISLGLAAEEDGGSDQSAPLPEASVAFEQNATDGDVEVVFEIEGVDEGLATLTVIAPDGRMVIDFKAPGDSKLGMRQFHFETPEPKDVDSLKALYPEGEYTFAGATRAGLKVHGKSTLSHMLPATASFLRPKAGARDVDAQGLEIAWSPVASAAAYIVEIEQEKLDLSLTARLSGSATTFAVPDGFLAPGVRYQLGIGAVAADGNVSFVEMRFTTAGGK